MEEPQNKKPTGRNPDGTFLPGVSGNPGGRPKNTLKEYVKKKLADMSEEEKEAYIKDIAKDFVWKMAEGNPPQEITGAEGTPLNPQEEKLSREIQELNDKFNEFLTKQK